MSSVEYLTIQGKDAFLDGFYPKEGLKDLVETLDLHLRVVLPVFSLFKKRKF